MEFSIEKLLIVNSGHVYLEIRVDDDLTIWTKDGSCMAVYVMEIFSDGLKVKNEEREVVFIPFKDIENIEEN